MQSLEKQLQEIDITYATEKQRIVSIDENIEQIQKRIEKLKDENSKAEESKKSIEASKHENEKQIENINTQNSKTYSLHFQRQIQLSKHR